MIKPSFTSDWVFTDVVRTLLEGSKRKDNSDSCYKTVYFRIVFKYLLLLITVNNSYKLLYVMIVKLTVDNK